MNLTPVKFQRNRSKTVGGIAYTRYKLLEGVEGRTEGWKDGRMEGWVKGQKVKYYVPSLFFERGVAISE